MEDTALFRNEAENNGEQYGISCDGDVGDNSTVNQSITRNANYSLFSSSSSNYSATENHDSHDVYSVTDSHDTYNREENHIDSHNMMTATSSYHSESHVSSSVSNSYSRDSHDSYDSHNSYTAYDDHSVKTTNTHTHMSFTSTGQAVAAGVFFGNGEAVALVMAAMVAAGIAIYVFIDTIMLAGAIISAIGLASIATHESIKSRRRKQYVRLVEEQALMDRQAIIEQREHELRLAELSRPLYITVNKREDLQGVLPATRPIMIEDNSRVIDRIEFTKGKEKEYAYRSHGRASQNNRTRG